MIITNTHPLKPRDNAKISVSDNCGSVWLPRFALRNFVDDVVVVVVERVVIKGVAVVVVLATEVGTVAVVVVVVVVVTVVVAVCVAVASTETAAVVTVVEVVKTAVVNCFAVPCTWLVDAASAPLETSILVPDVDMLADDATTASVVDSFKVCVQLFGSITCPIPSGVLQDDPACMRTSPRLLGVKDPLALMKNPEKAIAFESKRST